MDFQAGDIIEGYEGNGTTWGNISTILILYIKNLTDVSAVILNSINPITGKNNGRCGELSNWTLSGRDWKKIGCVPELEQTSITISNVVSEWKQQSIQV